MSPARRWIIRLSISLALVGTAAHVGATSFFDPIYRYRTLFTAHFSIHFHRGEDDLARRLATIAEDVWQQLRTPLGAQPPSHTEVVLVDQSELANGLATPLPYGAIVVTAVWPAGSELIGKTDDWLRLAFTHEFTHIVHLDRSEGWARIIRRMFGRTPIAFPNIYLPKWQVEGLATYEESLLTGGGRLHAGDFGSIVREAARRGRLEPLDRVNGGLTDWPAGDGIYAYGAGFHEYLAERFGDASFARLAEATARQLPFTASRVFRQVYGRSLGDLWRNYEDDVRKSLASDASGGGTTRSTGDDPRRLTRHGYLVAGPRFDPSICSGCDPRIIYSARTFDDFPALYEISTNGGSPKRLANRYLGATSGISERFIYFDQQELHRNSGLYSDLYALERATGHVRALTSEARLLDPDLSPDRATLVAVQGAPGRRDLVLVDVSQSDAKIITTLLSEPDTQFDVPRWSPDGRTIVAERHRLGHLSEIVLVDVETRTVRPIAADAHARFVTPTWRPDGGAIVTAADFNEGPFKLYEVSIGPEAAAPRALTLTTGGATWPAVSPDGNAIAFVGYTVDGFDLFVMPYPRTNPVGDASADGSVQISGPSPVLQEVAQTVRPEDEAQALSPKEGAQTVRFAGYNPVRTLRPTSWSPIVDGDRTQLRIGLTTGGLDVLRYHVYNVSASWLANGPSGAIRPDAGTPDWRVSYAYDRWRPTFWLAASNDTSFLAGGADAAGIPLSATLREQQVEAGIIVPFRHVRTSQTAFSSLVRATDDFFEAGERLSRNRTAWRGAWSIASAREYGYSISREDGGAIGVTAELAREALGSSADASILTADGRAYWSPIRRHHVLAVRFAGGRSSGDATAGRTFHLGGGQSNTSTVNFGRNAISLLRGFGSDTFAGSHVALLNVDYRWPITRPQRGYGTWPLFVHTIHAAVFTDLGHAWTQRFRMADAKASAGVELSTDVIAGYWFPFTATVGAGWGRDGSRTVATGGSVYVRIGRAF